MTTQYEVFPYPPRDPADEYRRLCMPMGESLEEIAHHLFQGRLPAKFRVLVAGGGTGDNITYLAHQLKDQPDATLVYVDICEPSLKIARARCQIRGVANRVHWLHASLLDLPQLSLEPFDFITCTGVLHHLEDPEKGLAILRSLLKPNGGMHLMVYAKYGRMAVSQIQELLRLMLPTGDLTPRQRLSEARKIVADLPKTNWFWQPQNEILFGPVASMDDAEFYDLFLNERERSYSVPELFQFLHAAAPDLHFVNFSEPITRVTLGNQPAINELKHGNVIKHAFYVSLNNKATARLEDPETIPYFFRFDGLPLLKSIRHFPAHAIVPLQFQVTTQQNLPVTLMVQNPTTFDILCHMRHNTSALPSNYSILHKKDTLTPLINAGLVLLRKQ